MSRFDHPVYRNASAAHRTATQRPTEDMRRPDGLAGRRVDAPSPWPILIFAVLMIIGTLLTTGLLP